MQQAGKVRVTQHAAERWQERVHACDDPQREILIHETAIRKAAAFGAKSIKLPSRHRLILKGLRVVTVLPQGRFA